MLLVAVRAGSVLLADDLFQLPDFLDRLQPAAGVPIDRAVARRSSSARVSPDRFPHVLRRARHRRARLRRDDDGVARHAADDRLRVLARRRLARRARRDASASIVADRHDDVSRDWRVRPAAALRLHVTALARADLSAARRDVPRLRLLLRAAATARRRPRRPDASSNPDGWILALPGAWFASYADIASGDASPDAHRARRADARDPRDQHEPHGRARVARIRRSPRAADEQHGLEA